MRTPAWCRRQAAAIGPACEQVIAGLLADNAPYRLRAAQGVPGLADRHDPGRLEAACATAITAGDPFYRTIKGILAAGTETGRPPAPAGDGSAAAFLPGPASFAHLIPCPGPGLPGPAPSGSSWSTSPGRTAPGCTAPSATAAPPNTKNTTRSRR
jgi:hypothetical protein